MKKRVISITAKCSDMFSARLKEEGKIVGEYDGYVPQFMPGQHYGDYVELEIDIATGKILNWTPPTQSQLDAVFVKEEKNPLDDYNRYRFQS